MARAAGTVVDAPGGRRVRRRRTLPILIHGDAAFPGQGVVAETLNLSPAAGLRHRRHDSHHRQQPARLHRPTPDESYSTQLRERPGARIQDPDRPRQRRRSDGVPRGRAAGVGISRALPARLPDRPDRLPPPRPQRRRRAGVHAAGDVPEGRRAPDRARASGRGRSVAQGRSRAEAADALVKKHFDELEQTLDVAQAGAGLRRAARRAGAAAGHRRAKTQTAVPLNGCARSTTRCCACRTASRFTASSNAGARRRRHDARQPRRANRRLGRQPRSWRSRRSLPTASPIRLTGEDVERGTFSHRHAVFHDANNGQLHRSAAGAAAGARRRSRSTTVRSARTRVVGFEFGYNIQEPSRLVIWEAQYGDFINGAQMMIDEFVVSARAQVGTAAVAGVPAAARHTKGRGRSTPARAPSGFCSWRRTSTSASRTAPPPRSISTCCAGRRRCFTSIRCRWSC